MKTNVTTMVHVNWLYGGRSFEFEQGACNDQESCKQLVLDDLGVTDHEFDSWYEVQGRVQCIANTSQGKQCKCHVSGVVYEDPKEWVAASKIGGYCRIHGGD